MNNLQRFSMAVAASAMLATVPLAGIARTHPDNAALPASPQAESPTGIPAVQADYRGRLIATITQQGGNAVLTIENADGSKARSIAVPDGCQPTAIRWARRWDSLAVLTQCTTDSAHPQPTGAVWVMDVQADKPLRKLADFDGTASKVQWRSDGKVIAFLLASSAPSGSNARHKSVIVAIRVAGGKLETVSPPGFDIHDFYLSGVGNGLAYTATPVTSPSAPPALYEVVNGRKSKLLLDPETVQGPLHGVRIGRPRWGHVFATPASSLFFLGRSASASQPGADLYIKLANDTSPITNLTASESIKPEWFWPFGTSAIATREVDGSTQLVRYDADGSGGGLVRTEILCTIPGTITDGHGPGSMSTNGTFAYFEYPKAGGPMTLNVGLIVGMCRPRWSRPVGDSPEPRRQK